MIAAGIFTIAGMIAWQSGSEHTNSIPKIRAHFANLGLACWVVAALLGAHVIGQ